MNMAKVLACTVFPVFCMIGVANAEPMAMTCNLVWASESATSDRFRDVDVILIDADNETLELRVGSSLSTSDPLTWVYRNDPSSDGYDVLNIYRDNSGVRGAGMRMSMPVAFWLTPKGMLSLQNYSFEEPRQFVWSCSK